MLLAAHCRPVFAAAAALILGFAVVWTTTFGIGDLGELPSLHDRAYAARATLLAISTCTLVLAALFAERRHKEAALEDSNDRLKDSNGRLQLALDCAELGTWSLHLESGRFENDVRDRHIHGHGPEAPPQTLAQVRSQSIQTISPVWTPPLRHWGVLAAAVGPSTVSHLALIRSAPVESAG